MTPLLSKRQQQYRKHILYQFYLFDSPLYIVSLQAYPQFLFVLHLTKLNRLLNHLTLISAETLIRLLSCKYFGAPSTVSIGIQYYKKTTYMHC